MEMSYTILPFYITRVWAKNYRSIAEVSVEFGPLTVLVGPNGSGKSTILDIVRFIKESLRFDLDTAISRRHGFDRILHRQASNSLSRSAAIELGLRLESADYTMDYCFTFCRHEDQGFVIKSESFLVKHLNGEEMDLSIIDSEPTSRKLELTPSKSFDKTDKDFLTNNYVLPSLYSILHFDKRDHQRQLKFHMQRSLRLFREQLRSLQCYHIFPDDIRKPQRPATHYPLDENGNNLASVLRDMEKRHPDQVIRLEETISHLIQNVEKVRVEEIGGFLVIELGHVSSVDKSLIWFDLSQESDGTLRVLGLLTAIYQVPYHPLVGIEEPEFAVHPGILPALAEIFEEASRTTQLIITTHSPDLIDQLSTDCLRVVESVTGITAIGNVSGSQVEAIRQNLFSPGELHRTEGLRLAEQN